ncbi:MAG TPA: DUF3352 domain-containing protein [Solirubrobacteraceae bacterium]|nr:DUF3352 domain-containing protein [Solirubrobacteraceae bacterium]
MATSSPSKPAPSARRPAGGAASPAHAHRRLAAAVGALGLVLLAALLVFAFRGSSEPPPATGAAALVPADALMYVHLSTDASRPAVRRWEAVLRRLPDRGAGLGGIAQRVVAEVSGSPTATAGALSPWLGPEAAFALLNTPGVSAGSIAVLAVRDHARAAAFVARAGARTVGSYRGDPLLRYPTGAELAFVRGYLVVGQDAGVRAAIDTAAHRTRSLAGDSAYRRASAGEPDGRVLDVYLSAAGVSRVLDAQPGFLGLVGTLLSRPGLLGTAISVTAQAPGLRIRVHSALNPRVARAAAAPLAAFTPTLQNVLPAGTTLMLDARNLNALAPGVLRALGQVGLLGGVPDLFHRVGVAMAAQGTQAQLRALLRLFSGETAVALAAGTGAPALVIVTRTSHQAAARVTLGDMAAELAQLFTPDSGAAGVVPEVSDVQVGGVTAASLQLAPGLQVDYAVFRGLVVVSTSVRGIADMVERRGSLAGDPRFAAVLGNRPSQVTSLGFADFSQLLSLGEQSTLERGSTFRALQPDLEAIRAAGLDSTRGEADTTAELDLQTP